MKYMSCCLVAISLLFGSCQDSTNSIFAAEAIAARDSAIIAEYLAENNLTATRTASGLYYINFTTKDSTAIGKTDSVAVDYRGRLLYGDVFDSSYIRGERFGFRLGEREVIDGWEEGVQLMRVGDSSRLIIPSGLGYGISGQRNFIPSNAILVFDVVVQELYP